MDSPDLSAAKRLLDDLKLHGFVFWRTGPGPDAPLVGNRVSAGWIDRIHIEGFSCDCSAWRTRISPLIIPGSELMGRQVQGSALTVLTEVMTWEPES